MNLKAFLGVLFKLFCCRLYSDEDEDVWRLPQASGLSVTFPARSTVVIYALDSDCDLPVTTLAKSTEAGGRHNSSLLDGRPVPSLQPPRCAGQFDDGEHTATAAAAAAAAAAM